MLDLGEAYFGPGSSRAARAQCSCASVLLGTCRLVASVLCPGWLVGAMCVWGKAPGGGRAQLRGPALI